MTVKSHCGPMEPILKAPPAAENPTTVDPTAISTPVEKLILPPLGQFILIIPLGVFPATLTEMTGAPVVPVTVRVPIMKYKPGFSINILPLALATPIPT